MASQLGLPADGSAEDLKDRFSTPSTLEIYPVALSPGSTSKPNSTILTVHDEDLTTLVVINSELSITSDQTLGFFPSEGMKSVCLQPHSLQMIVISVCSPKYGISEV